MLVAGLLLLALVVRLGYVAATPDYRIVHDGRDYDRHARSLAYGEGYATIGSGPTRETAFRPPAYPYFLAGVYEITGTARAEKQDRADAGRVANALVGTGIVALIGLLCVQLFDRRVALVAMALGAVYLPLVLVGGTLMSEPLFAALMLGALVAAIQARSSPRPFVWIVVAGVLAGLMVLARANAVVLLVPLAAAVWVGRPRWRWRSIVAPAVLVLVALLTIAPWTIRNAVVFDRFIPVSTQLGSALAGTYNEDAHADRENPASWRNTRDVRQWDHILAPPRFRQVPEPQLEHELRAAALRYAADHPGYVFKVAWWNTRRMLDLASRDWTRHTAATIGVTGGWADAGAICFWVFAVLAVAGAFVLRRRGGVPLYVVAFPVLMYLSVVFLVFETPRYRTGIDPFIVILAALAVASIQDVRWPKRRVRSAATSHS